MASISINDIEKEVRKVKAETSNALFSMSCNEDEWTLIVSKTATKFTGTIEEVLKLYIEEITAYRTHNVKTKHVKHHKEFNYK